MSPASNTQPLATMVRQFYNPSSRQLTLASPKLSDYRKWLTSYMAVRLALNGSILIAWLWQRGTSELTPQVPILAILGFALYTFSFIWRYAAQGILVRWLRAYAPWLDAACCALLFACGTQANPLHQLNFFLVILFTARHFSNTTSVRLTLALSAAFAVVWLHGYETGQIWAGHTPSHLIAFPVIGLLLAHWGAQSKAAAQQLGLLRHLIQGNPRLGADYSLGLVLHRLRKNFQADSCLLIISEAGRYGIWHLDEQRKNHKWSDTSATQYVGTALCDLPQAYAYGYRAATKSTWRQHPETCVAWHEAGGKARADARPEAVQTIVALLDAAAFLTVPVQRQGITIGRLYLATSKEHTFTGNEAKLLLQTTKLLLPAIENMRLAERLANVTAQHERTQIARDIHDGILQPYIGLQLGLTALQSKIRVREDNMANDIACLSSLAQTGVNELRHCMNSLRDTLVVPHTHLLGEIQHSAKKFTATTGITVHLEAEEKNLAGVPGCLIGEVFYLVAEGLSNIRRHTQATAAEIIIRQRNLGGVKK